MKRQSYVSDELIHFVGRAKPNNSERYALLLKILGSRHDPQRTRNGWLQASYREEFGPGFVMRSDGLVVVLGLGGIGMVYRRFSRA